MDLEGRISDGKDELNAPCSPTREPAEKNLRTKPQRPRGPFCFQSNAQSQVVPLTPQRLSPGAPLCHWALGTGAQSASAARVAAPRRPSQAGGPGQRGDWDWGSPDSARPLQTEAGKGLEMEGGWGAGKAAIPQHQGPRSATLRKKGERSSHAERKKTPQLLYPCSGTCTPRPSGPGLQAFQTENLGREKPATRCPGSVSAESAPQRDVVFTQRGPLFWGASGAQEKPHCYRSEKAAFPEDAEPGSQQRRCLSASPRTAPSDARLCCANLQAVKTPSNSVEKNPNSWLWFCPVLKMPSNPKWGLGVGVWVDSLGNISWHQHLAIVGLKGK